MIRIRPALGVLLAFAISMASAASATEPTKFRRAPKKIENQYIVVLANVVDDAPEVIVDDLVKAHAVSVRRTWKHALKGFAMSATEQQAVRISRDSRVAFVEEDSQSILQAGATSSWALDRVDNRLSPRLDDWYASCSTGRGVTAYVIDTGIWRHHYEFSNPDPITNQPRVIQGFDYHATNRSDDPCKLPFTATERRWLPCLAAGRWVLRPTSALWLCV